MARPDVIALHVERVRRQVDLLLWAGIVLGLLFTMVNVQRFAAGTAGSFSSVWWAAWLLDPMVSVVLLAVLRAEQVTSRYQVPLTAWARRTKWCACAATYAMNTWESWGLTGAPLSASGVVLHSVPPLLVVLAAETGPGLRDRLTEAARRTCSNAASSPADAAPGVHDASSGIVHEVLAAQVHEPTGPKPRESRPFSRREGPSRDKVHAPQPKRRRLLAEYLDDARAALQEAAEAGPLPDVTPTWCRRVTGCSAGTSVKVAASLRAATPP
ncbi:hypothetical protein [Pseudonocardia sp. GCM10023141]|uniref:hypothetical protein n=1 Tax=Pseudonocardia sp. GCM10023141 TaxID=3252653 RepID=UPI003618144D